MAYYNNLNCYINLNAHKVEMFSMPSLFQYAKTTKKLPNCNHSICEPCLR